MNKMKISSNKITNDINEEINVRVHLVEKMCLLLSSETKNSDEVKVSVFNYLNCEFLNKVEELGLIDTRKRKDIEFITSDYLENYDFPKDNPYPALNTYEEIIDDDVYF